MEKVKRKAAQFREQYQTEDSFHIIDEEDNEETMDPLEEAYQESVNMSLLLENEKFKDVAKILTTDQFQYESINDYLNWVKRQGITVA